MKFDFDEAIERGVKRAFEKPLDHLGGHSINEILEGFLQGKIVPVVHGRWVKMTGMMPPEYHRHYECSECQWHMKGLRNSWTREEEMSYCPNCGAKMDKEEDKYEDQEADNE